jgi:hypothetical protein
MNFIESLVGGQSVALINDLKDLTPRVIRFYGNGSNGKTTRGP